MSNSHGQRLIATTKLKLVAYVLSATALLICAMLLYLQFGKHFTSLAGATPKTYKTIKNGNWNTAGTWDSNGKPPATLASGDSVIIKHTIGYNVNHVVLGVMLVEVGGVVNKTGNFDLEIGKGGVDKGHLINYGSITVRDLEVKPDNGCTGSMGLPTIDCRDI